MKRMYVEETLLIKNGFEPDETFILDNFDDYSYFKIQVGDFLGSNDYEMKYFEYYVNESNIIDDEAYFSDNLEVGIFFSKSTKQIIVTSILGSTMGIIIKGVKY